MKCSFSGKTIPKGKGIMYVKKDGKVFYFLNKKAEKNMFQLSRKPRTTKWTDTYHQIKKTEKA